MPPTSRASVIAAVDLSRFEKPLSVAERIALTDARVRQHVSYAIAGVFMFVNVLTLIGVAYMFHEDEAAIAARTITAQDRVITPRVIMTIVGAATVQLGALAVSMGRYLYKPSPRAADQDQA